jgi:hypothetical protein
MRDMALDFNEETYYKKYILAKLAYEAQLFVLKNRKNKSQPFLTVYNERGRQIEI